MAKSYVTPSNHSSPEPCEPHSPGHASVAKRWQFSLSDLVFAMLAIALWVGSVHINLHPGGDKPFEHHSFLYVTTGFVTFYIDRFVLGCVFLFATCGLRIVPKGSLAREEARAKNGTASQSGQ
jgi:hypothetical protein